MIKVYAPQIPSRFDIELKQWVPLINLNHAKTFGEVEVLLPPDIGRIPASEMSRLIKIKLAYLNPKDWLIAIGDPLAIGIMMIVASEKLNGKLKLLRWDKRSSFYEQITVII